MAVVRFVFQGPEILESSWDSMFTRTSAGTCRCTGWVIAASGAFIKMANCGFMVTGTLASDHSSSYLLVSGKGERGHWIRQAPVIKLWLPKRLGDSPKTQSH